MSAAVPSELSAEDWKRKIAAFLFRPPDAALYPEAGLAARRDALFGTLAANNLDLRTCVDDARAADEMAWAADRPPLADVNSTPLVADPRVRHPFDPAQVRQLWPAEPAIDVAALSNAVDRAIIDLIAGPNGAAPDPQRAFLALWRHLPGLLAERIPRIGIGWQLMPADGRLNDGLWSHAAMASAVAGAGNDPAVLLFTIAGTQDFVAQARRSQDFWAGSYLAAWLSWAAMRWVALNLGPDAILLPSLRGQPIVDHWLRTTMHLSHGAVQPADSRAIANLPNIFTAVVPSSRAPEIGNALVEAVREERRHIFDRVQKRLPDAFPTADDHRWNLLWEQQRDEFLEVDLHWATVPWKQGSELSAIRHAVAREQDNAPILDALDTIWMHGKYPSGAGYPITSQLAGQALASRKLTRDFPGRHAWNNLGACTLCGQRPALHGDDQTSQAELGTAWENWGRQPSLRGYLRRGERLCAVCLVKRRAFASYLGASVRLPVRLGFPSTASIATAPFKEAVLKEPDLDPILEQFVIALTKAFEPIPQVSWTLTSASMPPRLGTVASTFTTEPNRKAQAIKQFLQIDGEWLDPDSYQIASIEHAYSCKIANASAVNHAKTALDALIQAAAKRGILKPARYYAILVADGDKAGEWISGRRNPRYSDVLHPKIPPLLFDARRPSGPASQGALAASLSSFALERVPHRVEAQYPGKLIYAGGDDVVALVPLWNASGTEGEPRHVLELASRLAEDFRAGFREQRGTFGLGGQRHDDNVQGPAASLSVSVRLVHHSDQLAAHIREAFHSLKHYAKEELGRNALAITAVRRSGPVSQAGLQWETGSGAFEQMDRLLNHLGAATARAGSPERVLSPRLAHELSQLSGSLGSLLSDPWENTRGLALAEIRRLAERHSGGEGSTAGVEIANDIVRLAEALATMRHPTGELVTLDPFDLLVHLLSIAQFMQREA